MNHEIMTWAELKSLAPNRMSHPGAPKLFIVNDNKMKPTKQQKTVIHKEEKKQAMENALEEVHLVDLDTHLKAILIHRFKD